MERCSQLHPATLQRYKNSHPVQISSRVLLRRGSVGVVITCPLSSVGIKHWLTCKNTKQVRQQLANSVFALVEICIAQRRLVPALGVPAVCVC